jgi:hypothetical protein
VLQIGPFTWPEDGEITVTKNRNYFCKTNKARGAARANFQADLFVQTIGEKAVAGCVKDPLFAVKQIGNRPVVVHHAPSLSLASRWRTTGEEDARSHRLTINLKSHS